MTRLAPALFLGATVILAGWPLSCAVRAEEAPPPQVAPIVPPWAPVDKESTIKLKPGEYTIEELLDQILIQSGNYLPFANDHAPAGVRRKTVQVEKAETGFWEMVDLICAAGGLHYAEGSHHHCRGVALFAGERPACLVVKSGPAILRVRGLSLRRNLLAGGRSSSEAQLDVELLFEPRLVNKDGCGSLTFASAEKNTLSCKLVTDAGQELPYVGTQLLRSCEDGEGWDVPYLYLQMIRFAGPPAGTKNLSGRLAMTVRVGSDPRIIRLDLDAGETGGAADKVAFHATGFACGAKSAEIKSVELRRDGDAMPLWEWPWDSLRDADGRLLRSQYMGGSHGGSYSTSRTMVQTAWQAPQGPAARIEAAYYLRQSEVKLDFAFEKLPWSIELGEVAAGGGAPPKVTWEEPLEIPPIEGKPEKPAKKPPAPKPVPTQPEIF